MNALSLTSGVTYFGKVPARGDFIKGDHTELVGRLDEWVSQSMALLANDPAWKLLYDEMGDVSFAFVGARRRVSVIGHLRSSMDASQRRFPFLTAAAINRDDALLFRCGPVSFSSVWQRLHQAAEQACASEDPATPLAALAQLDCAADVQAALQTDPLGRFVRDTTVAELEELLAVDGERVNVRRIILAIGLLLRPALAEAEQRIDKGLCLPLPLDPASRDPVAGLWVYLITAFLRHSQVELQLLVGRSNGRPCLVVGFNGASPRTLLSLLNSQQHDSGNLVLDDPEWVEDHPALSDDYGVAKLSSYLEQSSLSLESAVATFREVFFGE